MSKLGLLLQVTLCLKPASHSVHALIHSEAEQNLINIKLAKHLTLSLILYLPILATELDVGGITKKVKGPVSSARLGTNRW